MIIRGQVPQRPDFGWAQDTNRLRDEIVRRELVVRGDVALHLGIGVASGDLVADSVAVAERVITPTAANATSKARGKLQRFND